MKDDNKVDSKNKKGMKKKKLFITAIFLILGISVVFAAWAFSYNNTVQATIIPGGGVLLVIEDISDFNVNAINESVNNSQNLTLFNKNGFKVTTLNFTVNKVLTEVGCTNYINDCGVQLMNLTSVINSGDQIGLFPGFNNFTLETSCVQNSCGQNISIEVDMQ